LGETGEHTGRWIVVQAFGALELQKGLVDGKRLNERRQVLHHRAHLPADGDVFLHVRTDDDGVGTGLQRLEHRHGRTHAVDPCDIAGGGDDAAFATADNDRLVRKVRIVALLDRRIKGVAVDMGERQAIEFGMIDEAGAAACATTAQVHRLPGKAVAAEARKTRFGCAHHAEQILNIATLPLKFTSLKRCGR
jgi:hypothetical protein